MEGRNRDPVVKYYPGGIGKSQKYMSDGSRGLNRCLPKPEVLPRKAALYILKYCIWSSRYLARFKWFS